MMLHFLNEVVYDAKSSQKIEIYVIIACLKIETMGKLINRIPGSRLFDIKITRLGFEKHVESLGKPGDVNKRSQSLAW